MRIAVPIDNGYISPHFGRCSSFIIVTVENGKVMDKEIVENPGHQPGFIP
jgi:predicted Fe-Mo cluster-binding NifX family protein